MTGDDHRQRIAADGTRHRAGSVHIADGAGDVLITARLATGDFPQRLPDAHLKRRADETQRQLKTAPLAGEKRGQLRRRFRQQRRRLLLQRCAEQVRHTAVATVAIAGKQPVAKHQLALPVAKQQIAGRRGKNVRKKRVHKQR